MATGDTPVIVSRTAGFIDALTALGRYIVVIIGAVPLLMQFIGDRNLIGLVEYFQGEAGAAVIAAVVAAGTLIYGLFKTFRRGDQIASVAANPAVPDRVAQVK